MIDYDILQHCNCLPPSAGFLWRPITPASRKYDIAFWLSYAAKFGLESFQSTGKAVQPKSYGYLINAANEGLRAKACQVAKNALWWLAFLLASLSGLSASCKTKFFFFFFCLHPQAIQLQGAGFVLHVCLFSLVGRPGPGA